MFLLAILGGKMESGNRSNAQKGNMKKLLSVVGLVLTITVANAQGTFEAITDYAAGSDTASIPGTAGWTFQPQVDLTVTALGCLDSLLTQPTVDIGLWTTNGVLLASVTVTNSSPNQTQPQYSSTTPVFLAANQFYVLGAYLPDGLIGLSLVSPGGANGSVTLSPDLKLGKYVYTSDGTFGFPVQQGMDGQMLLGATFQYTKNVPEPAILALLSLGGLGWLLWQRRR
jgi:hypothetical protein